MNPPTNNVMKPTQTHTLTFDGCGLNRGDSYKSRLAYFHNSEEAQVWGPVIANAVTSYPELLATLIKAEHVIRHAVQESRGRVRSELVGGWLFHAEEIRAAIARATAQP